MKSQTSQRIERILVLTSMGSAMLAVLVICGFSISSTLAHMHQSDIYYCSAALNQERDDIDFYRDALEFEGTQIDSNKDYPEIAVIWRKTFKSTRQTAVEQLNDDKEYVKRVCHDL